MMRMRFTYQTLPWGATASFDEGITLLCIREDTFLSPSKCIKCAMPSTVAFTVFLGSKCLHRVPRAAPMLHRRCSVQTRRKAPTSQQHTFVTTLLAEAAVYVFPRNTHEVFQSVSRCVHAMHQRPYSTSRNNPSTTTTSAGASTVSMRSRTQRNRSGRSQHHRLRLVGRGGRAVDHHRSAHSQASCGCLHTAERATGLALHGWLTVHRGIYGRRWWTQVVDTSFSRQHHHNNKSRHCLHTTHLRKRTHGGLARPRCPPKAAAAR